MMQPAGRRVTQEDLNSINERLDRLSNYQVQRRPPPPPPPVVVMPPPPPPLPVRRYKVREFRQSYDDNDVDMHSDDEYDGGRRGRGSRGRRSRGGVMDRLHLDDALLEATQASRQLKRMSANMRRGMKDELSRHHRY